MIIMMIAMIANDGNQDDIEDGDDHDCDDDKDNDNDGDQDLMMVTALPTTAVIRLRLTFRSPPTIK